MFNYIISDSGTITTVINNRSHIFAKDHPSYKQVLKAVKNKDVDTIERLSDIVKAVVNFAGPTVEVKNSNVYYKGNIVHSTLTKRILAFIDEGLPFEPFVKFFENLKQNPSKHSVDELYNFLVHRNLPITDDGCFLAYKRVTGNYLDCHTKTVNNKVGQVVEMERNEVDDNWRLDCSSGYHIGSLEYIADFGFKDDPIMIVKVNPKDVVSVPIDEVTKCRTCKYEVVGEMSEELVRSSMYSAGDGQFSPVCSDPENVCPEDEEDIDK